MPPHPYIRPGAGVVLFCLALITVPLTAHAGDTVFKPGITGSVAFEFHNDLVFSSDDATAEFNTLFTKIVPDVTVTLTDQLSINAGLVFQPVQDPVVSGDDRVFDDHGLYIETLKVVYQTGPLTLSGGKMHVNFASAWDVTPGVFGTDMAEEYEMAENIALGGSYRHDFTSGGIHTLTAQTFFLDTSGLAESAFTRRRKTREGDGGPGNTGGFSSFAVSLDGGEFPGLKGFAYHAAWVHQGNDTADATSETRFAVNGAYEFTLPGDITVQPFVEYVTFDDADGTRDQDRDYLTAALGFTYKDWSLALSATLKETEAADGTETDEEHLQVSAGYTFPIGVGLELGYKHTRNAGTDTDTFGTLLTYELEF